MFRCYKRLAPIMNLRISERFTPDENNLFTTIMDSIKFNPEKKETVARVAGGWVRDKLLGRASDDIDIALDNQSGEEFARTVNAYLKSLGKKTGHVAVIQANPDQSKHLETANVKVLNFVVDFVNLRSEEYATNSRIPEIRPGTPLEDAMRRDFTINALFYNLNDGVVEDLTGQGLNDLRDGLIRTPMDPMCTFQDDPLRVLRAIRFASRFNFTLHPEIVNAALHPSIQKAILEKVSRERVLKECDGMLRGSSCRPFVAIALIHRLNMFDVIFQLPADVISQLNVRPPLPLVSELGGETSYSHRTVEDELSRYRTLGLETARWCNVLIALLNKAGAAEGGLSSVTPTDRTGGLSISASEVSAPRDGYRSLFWGACTAGLKFLATDKTNTYCPSIMLTKYLKMDGDTVKQVHCLHETSQALRLLLRSTVRLSPTDSPVSTALAVVQHLSDPTFLNRSEISEFRMYAGLTLRAMRSTSIFAVDKESAMYLWRHALLLACAEDLAALHLPSPPPSAAEYSPSLGDTALNAEAASIIGNYGTLQSAIEKLGIDEAVWNLKPLLDGNKVVSELGLARGPVVSRVMEEQARWQLRYPNGTVEVLLVHLKSIVASSDVK